MGPSIETTTTYRRALSQPGLKPNICLGQNLKLEGRRIAFGEESRVGEDCYD